MNVTFLIGNGFDIGVGMKTKYSDFYSEYTKLQVEDQNILQFQEEIQKNIKDWADFEEAFGKHAKNFGKDEREKYLQQYEHFFDYFTEYLQKEEKNFQMPNDLEVISLMEKALNNYFQKLQTQDKEDIASLYEAHMGDVTYNFINFNYTTILDSFVNLLKNAWIKEKRKEKIGAFVHVHGLVGKSMIIGVNDNMQIHNSAFSEDEEIISEIIKPKINKELKMGYDRKATKIIKESNIICIYGMSLGETDRKWWNLIAKWLNENLSSRLVILNYQPDCDLTRPYILIKNRNKIINKFLSHSNLVASIKEKIKEQICIGINNNIFAYKKSRKKRVDSQDVQNAAEFIMQQKSMKLLREIGERQRKIRNDQL